MAPTTLLFTGATGYIGGTVLTELLRSTNPSIQNLATISLLVRGQDRADTLCKLDPRLKPILFHSLSNHEILSKAASEHDVVIHTCSGFDTLSAHALLDGLALRKKAGKTAVYIHTTGISNLGDRPIINPDSSFTPPPPIYSDVLTDDYAKSIPSAIHKLQADRQYIQRTTDILVQSLGAAYEIPTYLIMPPLIIGQGTGLYNRGSVQIPSLVRAALKCGAVPYLGDGKGEWSAIHIQDLGRAYETILTLVLEGRGEVTGKGRDGYFFAETFTLSWSGLALELADILGEKGEKVEGARSVGLDEGAELLAYGMKQFVEGSFGCNSRQRAQRVRDLGWEPKFDTPEVWKETLRGDVDAVLKGDEDHAVKSLIGMGM